MKKIIASILAVFFILLSPFSVWASTTEQSYGISTFSINDSQIGDGGITAYLYLSANDTDTVARLDGALFVPPLSQSAFSSDTSYAGSVFTSFPSSYNLNLYLDATDRSILVDKGSSFDFSVTGLYAGVTASYSWQIVNVGAGSGSLSKVPQPSDILSVKMYLADSNWSTFSMIDITGDLTSDGSNVGAVTSILSDYVTDDVYRIVISFEYSGSSFIPDSSSVNGFRGWKDNATFGVHFVDSYLSIDVQDESVGLIKGIIEWLKSIRDGITGVVDSITQLPNKIKDMLIGLIVPDSEVLSNKYTEFSALLEEKLGVIYQIPMMLFDFFDTIVNAATTPQSTLTLPAFTLPWIDGSQLTIWNSMEYKIIPDGLEVLSDLIRTVTSMTVVVLTFNSVKQAYERFLRS